MQPLLSPTLSPCLSSVLTSLPPPTPPQNPSPFQAGRYHSLVIDKASCPQDLEVTAWTEDGTIMGVKHKRYPHIQGVQFHPESIITQDGKRIVENFVKITKGEAPP
jgi:anthranilate/para-aminobenzoate synthase component II